MNRYKEAQWASFNWEYNRHTVWVYTDQGSKRQPPDIEPIRKGHHSLATFLICGAVLRFLTINPDFSFFFNSNRSIAANRSLSFLKP